MGAPYYGATAAVALMAGTKSIAALDYGASNYAGYVSFDGEGKAVRVLLYNSDYWTGSGTRGVQTFTLTGLAAAATVRAKRLTAAAGAGARVDKGDAMSFGGQTWTDGTCVVAGTETFETVKVEGGQASFQVRATEALVVYL